jgi:hypothetical protein
VSSCRCVFSAVGWSGKTEQGSYTSLPGLRWEPFVVTIIESEVMAQPAWQMVVLLVPSCLLESGGEWRSVNGSGLLSNHAEIGMTAGSSDGASQVDLKEKGARADRRVGGVPTEGHALIDHHVSGPLGRSRQPYCS